GQHFAQDDGDGASERTVHERRLGTGVSGQIVHAALVSSDGKAEKLKDNFVDVPGEREQRWEYDRYQSFSGANMGRPTQYPNQKCDGGERREKHDHCACRHGRGFVWRGWKPEGDYGRDCRLKVACG